MDHTLTQEVVTYSLPTANHSLIFYATIMRNEEKHFVVQAVDEPLRTEIKAILEKIASGEIPLRNIFCRTKTQADGGKIRERILQNIALDDPHFMEHLARYLMQYHRSIHGTDYVVFPGKITHFA